MIERLDITFCIYIFFSFSLSQLFLILLFLLRIEILAIELDLIIMNFTKGQNFIQEFRGRRNKTVRA